MELSISKIEKFLTFQEMELFSPKIKKVLIFSQKMFFLHFRKWSCLKKTSYISGRNLRAAKIKKNTQKKLIAFFQKKAFPIFRETDLEKFPYISGNKTFLYIRKQKH